MPLNCFLPGGVLALAVLSLEMAVTSTVGCSDHFCESVIRRLSARTSASVVVFQEDILIPVPSRGFGRSPRSLLSSPTRLWPNATIPYTFHHLIGAGIKARFEEAMLTWAELTCVRFVARTTEVDYIVLAQDNRNCRSYLGRVGGPQEVTIGNGCSLLGNALHELGHVIGLGHEHSRPDRGSFISVLWDNVQGPACSNFCKFRSSTVDSLGSPYDYGSIMHYGSHAFSTGRAPTILPHNRSALQHMGQRRTLSRHDTQQVQLIYGCPLQSTSTPTGNVTTPTGNVTTPTGNVTTPTEYVTTPTESVTTPTGSVTTPTESVTTATEAPPSPLPPVSSTWINGSYIVLRSSVELRQQYMACHVVLARCYLVSCRCGQCGNDEFHITSLNGTQVHSGDHITLHIDKGGNPHFLACDSTRGCSLQSSEVGVVRSCSSKETYVILSSNRRRGEVIRSGDHVTLQLCSQPALSINCGRKRCSLVGNPITFTILSRAFCT